MDSTESSNKAGPDPAADPAKSKAPRGESNPESKKPDSQAATNNRKTIEEKNPQISLSTLDVTFSFLALLLWVGLIAAGVSINSKHYVENLGAPTKHGFWVVAGSGLVVLTCHVVPNIALLSCLAAYLGVLASRTFPSETGKPLFRDGHKATFTMAITRGFYVYLIILSGSVLFSSQGFGQWATHEPSSVADSADYETYTRLAGLASLISFTAGYNPELYKFLLARISQFETKQQEPARPAGGSAPGEADEPSNEKVSRAATPQQGGRSGVPSDRSTPA